MREIHKQQVTGRPEGDDAENFRRLYSSRAQILYNLAVRVLRSAQEAETALTEVFTSALMEGGPAVDPEADPTDLLIARTRDLVTRRRRSRGAAPSDRPVDLEHLVKHRRQGNPDGNAIPQDGGPVRQILHATVTRCGTVTAAVVSHVYFGGLTIGETAASLSTTPSECRSRLHGMLEMIASRCGPELPEGRPCGYTVHSASHALGALGPEESPEYLDHLAAGCGRCESELSRFSRAAGKLAYLLQDVKLPPALGEKIFFSWQLARMVTDDRLPPDVTGSEGNAGNGDPAGQVSVDPSLPAGEADESPLLPGGDARPDQRQVAGARIRRMAGAVVPAVLVVLAVGMAGGLARYSSSLREIIDRQSELLESVQSKNTDLLLQYDRLAGVSDFFESEGMVVMLEGRGQYPGLKGKLVWDTTMKSAMLQILNLPPDLKGCELEVSALREGRRERVASLQPAQGDSGSVLYRFFQVGPADPSMPGEFSVAARGVDGGSGSMYRDLLRGTISGRRSAEGIAGLE